MIPFLLALSLLNVSQLNRPIYFGAFYQYSNQYGDGNQILSNVAVSVEFGAGARSNKPIIGILGEANVAVLLHTSTVEEVDEAANIFRSLTNLPLLGYIDNGNWTICASNPDWIGVMAYRYRNESLEIWDKRIRGMLTACKHKTVSIIIGTYNTNDGLILEVSELQKQFQYYAAWLFDYPNINSVLAFSDGRSYPDCSRGGMRCFPELRNSWNSLVSFFLKISMPTAPKGLIIK